MSHILEFLDLIDVPNTYSGLPGRPVVVKGTVDGVTFSDVAADFVSLVSTGFDGVLNSGTQDVQTAMATLDDHVHDYYLLRSEWNQNGFVDYTDVDIAWVDGTRTLTISPAVTSFEYYYGGVKTTETGSLAAPITDTEGLWAFYIPEVGATSLETVHNPSEAQVEDLILNQCLVAYVYWNATANDGRLMVEMHGSKMSPETHHYLHETRGSQYRTGLTLGDIVADGNGSSATHAQFSNTAGLIYDEDLQHTIAAHASTDTWECYYVDGSGYVRWVNCATNYPVYAIGGVIAYNNAGTLTPVGSQKYVLYHVFATNIHGDDGSDYNLIVTPGIAEYSSKALAQDAAYSEIGAINLGNWPVEEVIPIATVIYLRGAAMSNDVTAAIVSTETGGDYVDWRFTSVSGSSTTVNDHGLLSGLTDDDHTQYLLAAGTRALTADWDAGAFEIRALTFESDVATGTAPLTIASTTLVSNLNADLLDGNEASAFATSGHTHADYLNKNGTVALTADWDAGGYEIRALTFESDVATGTAPLTIASTTAVTNLNADLLDGNHAAAFATSGHTHADYLNKNGTVALTADWDAGGYEIRARTLESDVATGTAPLTIASTTAVTNLNADLLDGVHNSAMLHNNVANEITAITAKTSLAAADEFVLEDSAASYVKKAVTAANLATYVRGTITAAGFDTTAIHDNVANEITAITAKTTLADADEFVLEDSAASYVKKAVTAANLKSYCGGGGAAPQTLTPVNATGSTSSLTYVTAVDVSSGPYLIHLIANTGPSTTPYFKLTVDGSVLFTEELTAVGDSVVGAGLAGTTKYAMTICARSSFKLEVRRLSGFVYWRCVYQQIGLT